MRPPLKTTSSALTLIAVMTLVSSASAQTADVWRTFAQKLTVGSTVMVRTTAGDRITGVLMQADDEGVTVKPRTRILEPSRRVAYAEIEDLRPRPQHPVSVAKAVIVGAAIGAAVFLTLLVGFAGG